MPRQATPLFALFAVALAASAAAAAGAVNRSVAAQPPSPEPWHLEPIARYGGATHAVVGEGDVLYAGLGARVVALDIGDPAAPVQVGESPVLGGVVQDVVLEGELLYVAWQAGTPDARRGGLAVLGVADPTHIEALREAPVDVATRRLAVADGVALMVGSYDWQSFSNTQRGAVLPVDPRPTGEAELGQRLAFQNPAAAISVIGATAYVLEQRMWGGDLAAVRVLDVAQPQHPTPKSILALPGPPESLVATPSRLYVAAGESGLRVVDVATGPRPIDLGRASAAGSCADDVALGPGVLAVLDACAGRVAAYSLAADGWPVLLGGVDLPRGANRVAWLGDRLAVARGAHGGVLLVDAERPNAPVVRATWMPEGRMGAVASVVETGDGEVIVASHPRAGLTTLRAAGSGQPPALAGHLDVDGIEDVAVLGDHLVTTDDAAQRLDVFAVGDPDRPRLAGSLALPFASDVAAHPDMDIVYVPSHQSGLRVVSVADPARPALAATVPDLRHAMVVRGAGGLVALDSTDLTTLDIDDPLAPTVAGTLTRFAFVAERRALVASTSRAYVASAVISCEGTFGCSEIEVVDVSDPTRPRPITSHTSAAELSPRALTLRDGRLYVGGASGLALFDADALDRVVAPIAFSAAPGHVMDVAVLPDAEGSPQVFSAEGDAGLAVYRLVPGASPSPTASAAEPLPTRRPAPPATEAPSRPSSARIYLPFAARLGVAGKERAELRAAHMLAGPTLGLAIGDGVVYRGHGGAVTVIEPGPDEPREIGRTASLPGLVFDLAVDGDRLYAAVSEVGLAVYSVADPRRPVLLGTAPTGDAARSVAVAETTVFVAAGDAGLIAFDVADGAAPRMLSATPIERRAWRVWLYRGHAYVGSPAEIPIQVLDVADPSQPRRVAQLDGGWSGAGWALAFHDDLAYVVTCANCLEVFDVSDPASPMPVAGLADDVYAHDIAIDNAHLFVAGYSALEVYDLVDPHQPALVSTVPLDWPATRIAARGGLVATGGDQGPDNAEDFAYLNPAGVVELIDAANPARPAYLGVAVPPFANANGLLPSAQPGLLYLQGTGWTSSAHPLEADAAAAAPRAGTAQVEPYEATWVLDVTNPEAPQIGERVSGIEDVGRMVVDGTTGYALRGQGTLALIDLASTAAPTTLGSLDLGAQQHRLALSGGLAIVRGLVATGPFDSRRVFTTTLRIVDVGERSRPVLLGALDVPGLGTGLAVRERTAWLVVDGALLAIDLAEPSRPRIASRLPIAGRATTPWSESLVAGHGRLWVGTGREVITVDVADPANPRILGRSAGHAESLWLVGDDRLLGSGCGVSLFDRSRAALAMPIAELDTLPFAPVRCAFMVPIGLVLGDRFYAVPVIGDIVSGLLVLDVGQPTAAPSIQPARHDGDAIAPR